MQPRFVRLDVVVDSLDVAIDRVDLLLDGGRREDRKDPADIGHAALVEAHARLLRAATAIRPARTNPPATAAPAPLAPWLTVASAAVAAAVGGATAVAWPAGEGPRGEGLATRGRDATALNARTQPLNTRRCASPARRRRCVRATVRRVPDRDPLVAVVEGRRSTHLRSQPRPVVRGRRRPTRRRAGRHLPPSSCAHLPSEVRASPRAPRAATTIGPPTLPREATTGAVRLPR